MGSAFIRSDAKSVETCGVERENSGEGEYTTERVDVVRMMMCVIENTEARHGIKA